ncbi:MAG: tRNA uridine-5-carboxymethylaminomethyl(34) synthesis GTPase MnmE [Chitinophagaceae bacterium]
MQQLSGWDDTIVAIATPPGVGAIGVLRLSGVNALKIVSELFPSKDLLAAATHTAHVGLLKDGDRLLDEVVVTLFKAPRSYTGENVAEISCHGSPFVQQQVLASITQRGARLAKPGEFTQRAFLNGKLDLAQAEAVADLIAAGTEAAQKAALHGMRGGISKELQVLREQLLKFSALLELELDFSQEDVEFADRTQLKDLLHRLQDSTSKLLQSFRLGNVIRNGVSVAIVGKPNAGKSTLLNSLLNENRAIVSEIAGTTRDTIEEVLNIDGILFRLIDTAGIRSYTQDLIETAGIERSLEKMRTAQLVLYVFDVNESHETVLSWKQEADQQGWNYLLVGNKLDELAETVARAKWGTLESFVLISAKENLHLATLKERMIDQVLQDKISNENTIVTNARHYHVLQEVHYALIDTQAGMEKRLPSDLIALEIRRCLHYLGEITGEITNEDQLDYIFSKFCIGK